MTNIKVKTSAQPEIDEHDPEFKEFMNLQRNIGKNSRFKHVWSDDAKMDAENVAIPAPVKKKAPAKKPINESTHTDKDHETKAENPETEKKSLLHPDYGTKSDHDTTTPRKRHKRSRPKKKSSKAKPKEIFVHTIKVKGIPEDVKRKDVINFFKPLELLSIRLNKKDRMCYVSFKDKGDLMFALRKDMHFWGTCRIKCVQHNVKRSKIYKKEKEEKRKVKEEQYKKYEAIIAETEPVEESGRLFIRNLNYNCKQEDLEEVFSKYGELTEVHFPIDKQTRMPKGYAYVEFMFPKNAARAYEELNGTQFQGRNFHLIPSKPKPEPKLIDGQAPPRSSSSYPLNQSSFKREKMLEQKQVAPKGSNWNILFLGQNALADVVSESRGVDKSKLLTQQTQKDPIAVRMALGDASAVDEMRKFLITNGVELDSFDNPQAPRSRNVIIVKNLPSSDTNKQDLLALFEPHGRVARVIVPPNGLTAIVEMEEPVEAKVAFKKLAYSKFKDSILYLEWAPINVFREKSLVDQEKAEMEQMEKLQTGTKILVKNVPFEATSSEIKKVFAAYGELNFVRLPKKIDGQHRGFAFVDFLTKEDALRAFRGLGHSTHLYGRKLILEWAK
uniref:Putative RNA-binding protein 19 n=1 Tax=Aceria tosichella TaxID=561515 RepID=A0A6G1S8Q6_9ACAR